MSEMVERVARAIYAEQCNIPANAECWPFEALPLSALCWREARAAIAAMREPTKEMCESGWGRNAEFYEGRGFDEAIVWRAMIDAALAQ